jgi:hypothetical protein
MRKEEVMARFEASSFSGEGGKLRKTSFRIADCRVGI